MYLFERNWNNYAYQSICKWFVHIFDDSPVHTFVFLTTIYTFFVIILYRRAKRYSEKSKAWNIWTSVWGFIILLQWFVSNICSTCLQKWNWVETKSKTWEEMKWISGVCDHHQQTAHQHDIHKNKKNSHRKHNVGIDTPWSMSMSMSKSNKV